MYRVVDENGYSFIHEKLIKCNEVYEAWKVDKMADGVDMNISYIEIQKSEDDFEKSWEVIKRCVPVVDDERMAISTPFEEGYDWEYWAKWKEVIA